MPLCGATAHSPGASKWSCRPPATEQLPLPKADLDQSTHTTTSRMDTAGDFSTTTRTARSPVQPRNSGRTVRSRSRWDSLSSRFIALENRHPNDRFPARHFRRLRGLRQPECYRSRATAVIRNAGPETSMPHSSYSPCQPCACTQLSAAKAICRNFCGVMYSSPLP